MRAALAALLGVAVLAMPTLADADQRFASPGGTGESCSKEAPCSLQEAIVKAKANDEVIVTAGVYTVTNPLLVPGEASNLSIHGDLGGPMPTIKAEVSGILLGVYSSNSRISYLEIANSGPFGSGLLCGPGGVVERVRVSVSGNNAVAGVPLNDCLLRDSLLLASGQESIAILPQAGTGGQTGNIHNVTAIATGQKSVGVRSFYVFPVSGGFTANISNSIVSGGNVDLEATDSGFGPGNIAISHSNFDSTKNGLGTAKVTSGPGNQTAPPLFVDAAAGDFREAPGSPTVDAGAADALIGEVDLAGATRVLGPAPDIGAFEVVPPQGNASIARLEALSLAPKKFRTLNAGGAIFSAAKAAKAPVGTNVTYTISAAGTPTFTVERKIVGSRVKGKCVKRSRANRDGKKCPIFKPVKGSFTHTGAAGQNRFRFSGRPAGKALKPGSYRLAGSAGGVVKRASFRIVK